MSKILLIPEFDAFGGTRTFFKNLLKFYASLNYEVVILLPSLQLDEEIKALIESHGFRYSLLIERTLNFKKLWFRFPTSVFFDIFAVLPSVLKERPDLVVTSSGTPGIFLGLFVLPVKYLHILHTYPTDDRTMSIKKLFLYPFINKHKLLLTVSQFSKNSILKFWVAGNKSKFVRFVYNSTEDSSVQKEFESLEDGALRVLTIGHVAWYKNPKLWVKVAKKVIEKQSTMNIEFIWAGGGDLLNECTGLARDTGFNNIRYIGYRQDIDVLYAASKVYFQPSLLESHGLSVIDAMRWSLPCVVSDSGGLPESVKNGETGYVVNSDDIDSMAEKIIFLLTNPEAANKMGTAARKYYQEKFSYSMWENNMTDIHNQLLQNQVPH